MPSTPAGRRTRQRPRCLHARSKTSKDPPDALARPQTRSLRQRQLSKARYGRQPCHESRARLAAHWGITERLAAPIPTESGQGVSEVSRKRAGRAALARTTYTGCSLANLNGGRNGGLGAIRRRGLDGIRSPPAARDNPPRT